MNAGPGERSHPVADRVAAMLDGLPEATRGRLALGIAVRALEIAARALATLGPASRAGHLIGLAREVEMLIPVQPRPGGGSETDGADDDRDDGDGTRRGPALRLVEGKAVGAGHWERSFPRATVEGQDWMLSVLTDLADFADWSDLPEISDDLTATRRRIETRLDDKRR